MADAHKNFARSTVATAPSPASSGTSLVVASGDGTKFPAVPFNAVIAPAGQEPTAANAEVVRVTAISTDTFTITRAQESSSARTVLVGDEIIAGITAKTLTDAEGYVLYASHAAFSPLDSTTYYWGAFPAGGPSTIQGIERIGVPRAGTITRIEVSVLIVTTNGSNENITFTLQVNGVDAVTLSSTKKYNGGTNIRVEETYSGLSVAVAAGDHIEFKEIMPAFATNPANVIASAQIFVN